MLTPSARTGVSWQDGLLTDRPLALRKVGCILPPFKSAAAKSTAEPVVQNNGSSSQPVQSALASAQNVQWQGKLLTSAVGLLTVRAKPGVGQRRIGAINMGEVHPILDRVEGWFKRDFKGKLGYRPAIW